MFWCFSLVTVFVHHPIACRQACSSVRALVVLFCSGTTLYLIRYRHNTPFDACSEAGGDYMTVGAVNSHNTAEVLTVSCKAAVR